MILVAGGTGRLGSQLVPLLTAAGRRVRVLTREPARAQPLAGDLVEVAAGDVREPDSLAAASKGVSTVVSAVQGFVGPAGISPRSVDHEGNVNLIRAAEAAGAEHFVLVSVIDAAPDHPMELMRMKHRAEEALKASQLAWTIVRSAAFMELYAGLVGGPLLEKGRTTVFGRGDNPNNFVSVGDVARFVAMAVADPALRGQVLEVGGPESLTFNQLAGRFQRLTGGRGSIGHVPLPVMRVLAVAAKPFQPALARQVQAGVVMDTRDNRFDATPVRGRYPDIPVTSLDEVIARDYAAR
ncbi:MAG: SDR family oxidoreductase [Chloroflexota bacterium]